MKSVGNQIARWLCYLILRCSVWEVHVIALHSSRRPNTEYTVHITQCITGTSSRMWRTGPTWTSTSLGATDPHMQSGSTGARRPHSTSEPRCPTEGSEGIEPRNNCGGGFDVADATAKNGRDGREDEALTSEKDKRQSGQESRSPGLRFSAQGGR